MNILDMAAGRECFMLRDERKSYGRGAILKSSKTNSPSPSPSPSPKQNLPSSARSYKIQLLSIPKLLLPISSHNLFKTLEHNYFQSMADESDVSVNKLSCANCSKPANLQYVFFSLSQVPSILEFCYF